jgi:hypothetical protein
VSGEALPEESFFEDVLAFKIPVSIENSRNQRYQEFRDENSNASATYHNFQIKKTVKYCETAYGGRHF